MFINRRVPIIILAIIVIIESLTGCTSSNSSRADIASTSENITDEKDIKDEDKALLKEGGYSMDSNAFKSIKIENEYTRLEIDSMGRLIAFEDKNAKKSYLHNEESFIKAAKGYREYLPINAVFEDEFLNSSGTEKEGKEFESCKIKFELAASKDDKIEITTKVVVYPHYITFEIEDVTNLESIDELLFVNLVTNIADTVATSVNACYNNDFAACVMALTLPVNCAPVSNGNYTSLRAKCFSRFGITANKVAIIASPFEDFLEVIQEVEEKEHLPSPKLGGKWNKISDDVRKSYLFIHDISEENADEVIKYAQDMGAAMIMILARAWRETDGHYAINKTNFPNGINGLKEVVEKIQNAGLKAGMHFLPAEINQKDPYVTPIPDKRLYKDGEGILNTDIEVDTLTLDITENISLAELIRGEASAFPNAEPDPYMGRGMDILIDDEIIHYQLKEIITDDDDNSQRFVLESCTRGAYGTIAAPHKSGSKVYHLRRAYGNFLVDLDEETLLDEISTRVAEVFNYCGFDMIYFDGSERLQPTPADSGKDHWYYNAKLQYTFYNKLDRKENILFQGSSYSHFSWHMIARQASADGYRDVKNVLDSRSRSFDHWTKNFMPLDIGWYGIGASHITYDDIEYILCRSIGFNSSVGFSGSFSNMQNNPITPRVIEIINKYEKLRLDNYFSEEVKKMLRQPGIDYKLIQDPKGEWGFEEKTIIE